MAQVFIPAQLRDTCGGVTVVEVEGRNVAELVRAIDHRFPGIAERLVQDDELISGLAVAVDGTLSSRGLITAVGPKSEVHFLPALGGG